MLKEAARGVGGAVKAVATSPKTVTVGYFRGLRYPFRGMKFVYFEHPGLVRFWIVPILITLAVLSVVGWAAMQYHTALLDLVWEAPEASEGFWDKVLSGLHAFFDVVLAIVMFIAGAVVVAATSSVIAAPFNDALSEEVERLVTGVTGPKFSVQRLIGDTLRTIAIELFKLSMYFVIMVPLFILSMVVPVFGQIVYSVFGFLFTSVYFAVDYIDWPASRRSSSVNYRLGLLKKNALSMLGFGSGVWLFLMVPLVNLLFMPAAVAGGTLLFLDLAGPAGADGAVPRQSDPPLLDAPAARDEVEA